MRARFQTFPTFPLITFPFQSNELLFFSHLLEEREVDEGLEEGRFDDYSFSFISGF
jgi:hypothetical protein